MGDMIRRCPVMIRWILLYLANVCRIIRRRTLIFGVLAVCILFVWATGGMLKTDDNYHLSDDYNNGPWPPGGQPKEQVPGVLQNVLNSNKSGTVNFEHTTKVTRLASYLHRHILNLYEAYVASKPEGVGIPGQDNNCKRYRRAASMERLVISDILKHSQHLVPDSESITLIAHMTADRLDRFHLILQQWTGPISISIYVKMEHLATVLSTLLTMDNILSRRNVLLHIVPEDGLIYPVNFLRNVALNATTSKYIFLTDIDFIPVTGSHDLLLHHVTSINGAKKVFVVPAFEEKLKEEYTFPRNKKELIELWQNQHIIGPFHIEAFPSGHHRTNFPRWSEATEPYQIEYEDLFEPYIVGERRSLPLYSQLFVGRSMNKIQQLVETVAMGFKLFVHPDVFHVHLRHGSNKLKTPSQGSTVRCSGIIMKEFNKYIYRKYGYQ